MAESALDRLCAELDRIATTGDPKHERVPDHMTIAALMELEERVRKVEREMDHG